MMLLGLKALYNECVNPIALWALTRTFPGYNAVNKAFGSVEYIGIVLYPHLMIISMVFLSS